MNPDSCRGTRFQTLFDNQTRTWLNAYQLKSSPVPKCHQTSDDFRLCTNVSSQTSRLENQHSTSAMTTTTEALSDAAALNFVSEDDEAGKVQGEPFLTDSDWRTTEPPACHVSEFTAVAMCCSVWLPFLLTETWSINNGGKKAIKRVKPLWAFRGKHAQLHPGRWQSEAICRDFSYCWSLAYYLLNILKGLHGRRRVMKILLSSELRRVWQKLDQTNQ